MKRKILYLFLLLSCNLFSQNSPNITTSELNLQQYNSNSSITTRIKLFAIILNSGDNTVEYSFGLNYQEHQNIMISH